MLGGYPWPAVQPSAGTVLRGLTCVPQQSQVLEEGMEALPVDS